LLAGTFSPAKKPVKKGKKTKEAIEAAQNNQVQETVNTCSKEAAT
jgi:hypothetical protein